MTQEQENYIEAMRIWFRDEQNQNDITRSNIENAKEQIRLYNIELSNKEETLAFDLKRNADSKESFNQWCIDNDIENPFK